MEQDRIKEYGNGWNAAQRGRGLPATCELIGAIGYRDAKSTRARRARLKAKAIPQRTEGWRFAGAAGRFHVWHAGKNDYRVTDGGQGAVIRTSDQFGIAYARAAHLYDLDRLGVAQ